MYVWMDGMDVTLISMCVISVPTRTMYLFKNQYARNNEGDWRRVGDVGKTVSRGTGEKLLFVSGNMGREGLGRRGGDSAEKGPATATATTTTS